MIKAGIIGAGGYTGIDLVRLLVQHPQVDIRVLVANSDAGRAVSDVFAHTLPAASALPVMLRLEEVDWRGVDVVFCCLPHGTSLQAVASLPETVRIVDLSADFRLRDIEVYRQWYGVAHTAPERLAQAVYGLSEVYRESICTAQLVACPGCYPTAALLPLLPLLRAGLVAPDDIIIDAKSGVTGAGRGLKQQNLFAEVAEAMHAYSVASHRHAPEIEQELSVAAGREIVVNFTPHLVPMNRGEYVTSYCRMMPKVQAGDIRRALQEAYRDTPFVIVREEGQIPATRHVRGSNYCHIAVFADRIPGRAIVVSALDNLVKGSGGQGVQNMNLMFGLPETAGLTQLPLMP